MRTSEKVKRIFKFISESRGLSMGEHTKILMFQSRNREAFPQVLYIAYLSNS